MCIYEMQPLRHTHKGGFKNRPPLLSRTNLDLPCPLLSSILFHSTPQILTGFGKRVTGTLSLFQATLKFGHPLIDMFSSQQCLNAYNVPHPNAKNEEGEVLPQASLLILSRDFHSSPKFGQ